MFSYMMAMLDFGDTLMILGLETIAILLKIWLFLIIVSTMSCYGSRLKGLSQEATLVLSNTRELDRVPNTK